MGRLFSPENFIRDDVINIFTDGSFNSGLNKNISAMATIVMKGNTIIYSNTMLLKYGKSANAAEVDAIRYAYSYAAMNMYKYNMINIFSDSVYAIGCVRDYIMNWAIRYNPQSNTFNIRKNNGRGEIVGYDHLLHLIIQLIVEYKMSSKVFLFHVKAHQYDEEDGIKPKGIDIVKNDFAKHNNIPYGEIDDRFAEYISMGNCIVDNEVKKAYGYYFNNMNHGFKPAHNPLTIYPDINNINELFDEYKSRYIQKKGYVLRIRDIINDINNSNIIWRQENGENF